MSEILERRLARAQTKIATLEAMIEGQTRSLFAATERLKRVFETVDGAIFVLAPDGTIDMVNAGATHLLGGDADALVGRPFVVCMAAEAGDAPDWFAGHLEHRELELRGLDGQPVPVLLSSNPLPGRGGAIDGAVLIAIDLRRRRALEMELRQAQKLESIGQLAAGVAHEINTPIQFVGDSACFLEEACEDLLSVIEAGLALRSASVGADRPEERAAACEAFDHAVENADLDFLKSEVPAAVLRTREGVGRVAKIVSAMRVFSHPGGGEMAPADVNEAIETTLIVARNEYKYVAELELSLGDIPRVRCEIGDINQAVLNIVVNAAHAIEAHCGGQMGHISVATKRDGDEVVVEIRDDGGGVPEAIRERIFDPFFTTKDVGKGTGQGLAIAHSVIVEKHGGSLRLETEEGEGSKFSIRLPIGGIDAPV